MAPCRPPVGEPEVHANEFPSELPDFHHICRPRRHPHERLNYIYSSNQPTLAARVITREPFIKIPNQSTDTFHFRLRAKPMAFHTRSRSRVLKETLQAF